MNPFLTKKRQSGILAHISSLPSPYGIGDIGPASWEFIDFLSRSGQSCWQFLPLNPTNSLFDNSPYMSTAALAGSPLLISPDLLYRKNLITKSSLKDHTAFSPYYTQFKKVEQYKSRILHEAYSAFNQWEKDDFVCFLESHPWLDDYAVFMSLKSRYGEHGWYEWPEGAASRTPEALKKVKEKYRNLYRYYLFEQYIFYSQWEELRARADEAGIELFGDIPIYVGLDSVDVWANQEIFSLDTVTGKPKVVSGVPPDYFSETGQRWGNPLYRWDSTDKTIQKKLTDWWAQRFEAVFELVDIARIDHFRGFESYWSIPAEAETALNGEWRKGPGAEFFDAIFARLGDLKIVAEDLGIITEEVHKLRDKLGFPGMKVIQFAFDGDPANSFLPHNFTTPNCVVYTGTHDNDTSLGWFLSEQLSDQGRENVKKLANREMHDHSPIHLDLIYLALSSTASLAIIPLQDVLGFGNDCKMNTPGVAEGNWQWRCAPENLTDKAAETMEELCRRFNRI